MWEESKKFTRIFYNKNGSAILDLYSHYFFHFVNSRIDVETYLKEKFNRLKTLSDYNLSANRGFFIYQVIEGSFEGQDYPVGYKGDTKMGITSVI